MENSNVEQLLNKLSEHLKSMVKTDTVIGDEFTLGEYTCKPVIKAGFGMAGGSGTGTCSDTKHRHGNNEGTGTGGGAGIGIQPIGFLATRGDEIKFIPSGGKNGLSTLFEKMPDIMDKMMDLKEKKESKTGDKKS